MPAYRDLVDKYTKRRKDTLMDTVTAGLSYADNVAVDLGLLDDIGMVDALTAAAPFAVIAVTEQVQVIMGVGALAGIAAGPIAAVPAAMGTRAFLSHYKSKSLLGLRIRERTDRLRALRERREAQPADCFGRPALPAGVEYVDP